MQPQQLKVRIHQQPSWREQQVMIGMPGWWFSPQCQVSAAFASGCCALQAGMVLWLKWLQPLDINFNIKLDMPFKDNKSFDHQKLCSVLCQPLTQHMLCFVL